MGVLNSIFKNFYLLGLVIVLGIFTFIVYGCGGGSDGEGIVPAASGVTTKVFEAQVTIGPEGGAIEVTGLQSKIHATKVDITEDAVNENSVFSVFVNTGYTSLPDDVEPIVPRFMYTTQVI
jgi:hypothetical protein